ncbi:hypothetical protein BD410DRAFT_681331, partial [Rickenella mellea]
MEGERGIGRGSYIWGRSVHNIRIERAWADVTRGFGSKWKIFFQELEAECELDIDSPDHIWLLHFLFLDAVNRDALQWAETWNAHTIQLRGQRNRSPHDLFFFGMAEHGLRGVTPYEPMDEDIEDPAAYGIDWEAHDDRHIMAHHDRHNLPDQPAQQARPFGNTQPDQLSCVEVNAPNCPLTDPKLQFLCNELNSIDFGNSNSMEVRRDIWRHAIRI